MPRITIKTNEAKTIEKKRELVNAFVEVCGRVLEVPKERVTVEIQEYDPSNLAVGGILACDKGLQKGK